MPSATKKVFFKDYVFNVWENVYEPAEDSFLFAENLVVKDQDAVLDMGTGCGILGIIAAANASKVVVTDINLCAVQCALENARINDVLAKMFFVQGDLFAPLKKEKQFDLILFNAPYLPTEHLEDMSVCAKAWDGGSSGREVIDRFVNDLPKYLNRGGRVFLMVSTLSDVDKTLQKFEKVGLKAKAIAKRDLPFFETLILLNAEY
jgi:release factor glutamine methyltransferase